MSYENYKDGVSYEEHYDATAAKGLCWECKTKRARKERVKLPDGSTETVESLWCLDCSIQSDKDCIDVTDKEH